MNWAYLRYMLAQVRQAWAKRHKPPHPHFQRLQGIVRGPVLCVGSRNRLEPEAWRRRGYATMAVDLLPARGVRWADFHALPFPDNSFGTIYGSHCWEHARDPVQALAEAARLLRPGGHLFAAFPVAFPPTAHDLVDFGSVGGFERHLPPQMSWRQLWSLERHPAGAPGEVAVLLQLERKCGLPSTHPD